MTEDRQTIVFRLRPEARWDDGEPVTAHDVAFTFEPDSADEPVQFELPIKRTVLIRQVSSDTPERRFVIELDIRLGEQLQTTEFTLTNRSRMTYPILLGRAFLMDLYVVDVSRSYTHDRYDDAD